MVKKRKWFVGCDTIATPTFSGNKWFNGVKRQRFLFAGGVLPKSMPKTFNMEVF